MSSHRILDTMSSKFILRVRKIRMQVLYSFFVDIEFELCFIFRMIKRLESHNTNWTWKGRTRWYLWFNIWCISMRFTKCWLYLTVVTRPTHTSTIKAKVVDIDIGVQGRHKELQTRLLKYLSSRPYCQYKRKKLQ